MPLDTTLRIYRNESDDMLHAKLSEAYDPNSPLYRTDDAKLRLLDEAFHRGWTLADMERMIHPYDRRQS